MPADPSELVCRRRDINRLERLKQPNNGIGIYDENHRLSAVAMWGPVGAEAALAQLLHPKDSLFHDRMNVVVARNEAARFSDTLTNYGVEIITIRDELARLIPIRPLDRAAIEDRLVGRAYDLYEKNKENKLRDGYDIGNPQEFEESIVTLLKQDIDRYGEEVALNLNAVLSLYPRLPLGNSMFSRDQSNIILGRRVQSTMAKPIRYKEVSLYEMVYKKMGLGNPIVIPRKQTFEGGDAYVHDGVVYVGVGERTTLEGAMAVYMGIKDELKDHGYRFAIVVHTGDRHETFQDQMDFMHLDTFSTPVGPKQMIICEQEAFRRRVYFVEDGNIVDHQQTFAKHLLDEGNELHIIPRSEQQNFGANLLALDHQTMFVPLDTNANTINGLNHMRKKVVNLDLRESTKGWGAAHCMVFQIKRC